uniref:C-type lectin domain-containing protein n=1 Tax=Poecilia mexicana TaxID=48701 RepID=A0A3B3Y619_9TELE
MVQTISSRLTATCSVSTAQCCFMDCQLYQIHYINESKTWTEAQQYCREKHTDLVTVTNMKDMKRLINISAKVKSEAWIGLTNTWRWSDGSSFSFRHWNNDFKNVEHNRDQCAVAVFYGKGRWKNVNCAERKPFICYDDNVILIKENKTWKDALTYCRGHHHDLVTITNMEDQIWIQEKVKNASTPFVWIGLCYAWTLHFWFWVSDEVVRYENWASCPKMNDCDMSGAMETRGGHKWLEKEDSETFNFICCSVRTSQSEQRGGS